VPVAEGAPRSGPIAAVAFRDADAARLLGGRHTRTWALFRHGDTALVLSSGGDLERYDTARDPGMQTDLGSDQDGRVASLRREAEKFLVGAIEPMPEAAPSEPVTEVAEVTP